VEEECLQTLVEDQKSEGDDWTSTGSVFHSMAAATGKERRPTVVCHVECKTVLTQLNVIFSLSSAHFVLVLRGVESREVV